MPSRHASLAALPIRLFAALLLVATAVLAGPTMSHAAPAPSLLTLKTVKVGAPGNPSVGITPFKDAIYRSCKEAPQEAHTPPCQMVGGVKYGYDIGQLEVTVAQWVAFLNTVDPAGRDKHNLYSPNESSIGWPKYGQIDFAASVGKGRHYSVASPEWADKPYGFANFLRSARFVNSLYNGRLLSKKTSREGGFRYVTYRVRLSRVTERGMYDMTERAMTRSQKSGFVVPSQNEWIKAAYFDPSGEGKYSYWKYPTNPGVFETEDEAASEPSPTTLDPTTGDVTNAATQPLATFHASGVPAPSWCPASFGSEECSSVNPFGIAPSAYAKAYQGSLSTVGQAKTTSPWGTLDQGGNAVEWTDTITPPPFGAKGHRVWRRLHGGIANAPVYQLWLSAIGLQPQDNAFYNATYPWLGIRIGVLGSLAVSKR
jgi:formylglycine-generating enzyme required for sulfatase activity